MKRQTKTTMLALVGLMTVIFLYAPLVAVVLDSFNASPRGGEWQSFTLHWYETLWSNEAAVHATKNTIVLALCSTLIATVLGTALALGLAGTRFRGRGIVESAMLGPVIVPDILLAVALLLLFKQFQERWEWFQPGLLTMTLAHVTFQIPFVALVVRARLAGFDASLEEAARDLGATRWAAFRHVKLPLLWPGIAAGALLAFTLSLDDFVVSFFTSGPGATTLPILIYSSVKRGITPEINALSSLFILAAVSGVILLSILIPRLRDRTSSLEQPNQQP